jgi:hypothetical protein
MLSEFKAEKSSAMDRKSSLRPSDHRRAPRVAKPLMQQIVLHVEKTCQLPEHEGPPTSSRPRKDVLNWSVHGWQSMLSLVVHFSSSLSLIHLSAVFSGKDAWEPQGYVITLATCSLGPRWALSSLFVCPIISIGSSGPSVRRSKFSRTPWLLPAARDSMGLASARDVLDEKPNLTIAGVDTLMGSTLSRDRSASASDIPCGYSARYTYASGYRNHRTSTPLVTNRALNEVDSSRGQ